MKKLKILIIEDDSIAALKIKLSLELAGYDVRAIAGDADTAINAVHAGPIDVIIADIQIKGELNGVETAELIQKSFCIPVIFLTAYHDDATLKEASKVDFSGYIVKPYLEEQLLREVKLATFRYGFNKGTQNSELGSGYRFDGPEQKLYCHNEEVGLTKQEMTLLQMLTRNQGEIISMETVELTLWYEKAVTESTRRQLLFRLKAKVPGLNIESIKGMGYKLHTIT